MALAQQIERLPQTSGNERPATIECCRPEPTEDDIRDLIDQHFPVLGHDLPEDFATWWSYQIGTVVATPSRIPSLRFPQ